MKNFIKILRYLTSEARGSSEKKQQWGRIVLWWEIPTVKISGQASSVKFGPLSSGALRYNLRHRGSDKLVFVEQNNVKFTHQVLCCRLFRLGCIGRSSNIWTFPPDTEKVKYLSLEVFSHLAFFKPRNKYGETVKCNPQKSVQRSTGLSTAGRMKRTKNTV